MPVRLFTDAERERLNGFPRDVPPGDLLASFTLSDADLDLIGDRRGDHNRLGYALPLKALPYLGFVPDDLTSAPSRLVAYLALQLSVPSEALTEYGEREHTRTDPILGEIAKLTYLRGLGADTCELAALTPNRRKLLARIGRRATNQALQRTPPERRYPILLAFLEQAVEEVICSIAP